MIDAPYKGWVIRDVYFDNDGNPINHRERQWQSLTDGEIMSIGRHLGLQCRLGGNPNIDFDYARMIEAKLKEKNNE